MRICRACGRRFLAGWRCSHCEWTALVRERVHVLTSATDDRVPGFEEQFFRQLDDAERGHFWFVGRRALILMALDRFFPDATSFLDAGAGTGYIAAELEQHRPSMRVTAVEPFMAGLRFAAARSRTLELVRADLLELPFEAEFDVAGAFDVLEHIEDDDAALTALARAIRPGGGLILTVPQHRFLWSSFDDHARHYRRYSRHDLHRLLERTGCTVLFSTSFVSLLLPAMLAVRILRTSPTDPLSELNISTSANRVCGALMSFERSLIASGVSFPAGGSLLVVARRTDDRNH